MQHCTIHFFVYEFHLHVSQINRGRRERLVVALYALVQRERQASSQSQIQNWCKNYMFWSVNYSRAIIAIHKNVHRVRSHSERTTALGCVPVSHMCMSAPKIKPGRNLNVQPLWGFRSGCLYAVLIPLAIAVASVDDFRSADIPTYN